MIMVRHQAIAQEGNRVLQAVFEEEAKAVEIVLVSEKDWCAMSSPVINMIRKTISVFWHSYPRMFVCQTLTLARFRLHNNVTLPR